MKTISLKVYRFSELSEDAKERACNDFIKSNVYYSYWYDFILSDAKSMGISIDSFDVYYGTIKGEFLKDPLVVIDKVEEMYKDMGDDPYNLFTIVSPYRSRFIELDRKWEKALEADDIRDQFEGEELEERLKGFDSEVLEYTEDDYYSDRKVIEKEMLDKVLEFYLRMLREEYEYIHSEEYIGGVFEENDTYFFESGVRVDDVCSEFYFENSSESAG